MDISVLTLNDVYLTLKGILIVCVAIKCLSIFRKHQSSDEPIQVMFQKMVKIVKAGIIAFVVTDLIPIFKKYWDNASIGSGSTRFWEKLAFGISAFCEDYKVVIIALDAIVTTVLFAKECMLYQSSSDEEKPQRKKKAIKILGAGICILVFYALIITIFGYYE